jgi:copper chaperone CopZ
MTHTYNITGMTCSGCQAKVQQLLSAVAGVKNVQINLAKGEADIEMEQHINTDTLADALKAYPKYQLSAAGHAVMAPVADETEERSWLATYKPILLIFAYISAVSVFAGYSTTGFSAMQAMRTFMSGFFLVFSFFKLLDLRGFAESYAMYDVVAKRFKAWGYLYAFIELALGIAYALAYRPFAVNMITLVVMSISIIGVLQSVLNKRTIKCACLGSVFNLPMSTVTIIEDGLMIAMAIVALVAGR